MITDKVCASCRMAKDTSCFSKNKQQKDGLRSYCRECIKSKNAAYTVNNADRVRASKEVYRKEHLEAQRLYYKHYAKLNAEKIKEKAALYYNKNKVSCTARTTLWRKQNKEQVNAKRRLRYKNDPLYRLSYTLRKAPYRIIKSFQCNGQEITKLALGHLEEYLGCTVQKLVLYIEQKFTPGMTWNNYGNKIGQWSIDHIIPLAQATTVEEALKLSNYTNLQPLWHTENIRKRDSLHWSAVY